MASISPLYIVRGNIFKNLEPGGVERPQRSEPRSQGSRQGRRGSMRSLCEHNSSVFIGQQMYGSGTECTDLMHPIVYRKPQPLRHQCVTQWSVNCQGNVWSEYSTRRAGGLRKPLEGGSAPTGRLNKAQGWRRSLPPTLGYGFDPVNPIGVVSLFT